MKAYDVPIKRFVEVASPELLKQLDTHSLNYTKYIREGNLISAKKELSQAKRVVLQLEAILREIEDVRKSLGPEDERIFFQKVDTTKQKVLGAIERFNKHNDHITSSYTVTEQKENKSLESTQLEHQILLEKNILEKQENNLDAVENLQKDIVELNELFVEFAKQIEDQGETVDLIENNVGSALNKVEEGVEHLQKADKLKTALYPLSGALLGTCIGGPIGLIAGVKVGALTALCGTVLGCAGGRYLKTTQEKLISKITMKKSQPVPDNKASFDKTCMTNSNSFSHGRERGDANYHLHND